MNCSRRLVACVNPPNPPPSLPPSPPPPHPHTHKLLVFQSSTLHTHTYTQLHIPPIICWSSRLESISLNETSLGLTPGGLVDSGPSVQRSRSRNCSVWFKHVPITTDPAPIVLMSLSNAALIEFIMQQSPGRRLYIYISSLLYFKQVASPIGINRVPHLMNISSISVLSYSMNELYTSIVSRPVPHKWVIHVSTAMSSFQILLNPSNEFL